MLLSGNLVYQNASHTNKTTRWSVHLPPARLSCQLSSLFGTQVAAMTWQRGKHRPRLNPAKIKDNSICNRGNFVKQMVVVTLSLHAGKACCV